VILCDRDKIFLGEFWQALFSIQDTDLLLSSAYHPQTDWQTEVVTGACRPTYGWRKWLGVAECWYDTTFQTGSQLTRYEIVYS